MSNEAKNINLLTDFGFKRFFGTEPYKKNLIHFLNAFLPPYIGTVTDVSYRPTEQLGMIDKNKRIVFDVFCSSQNESKENIVVEMQKASQEFLKNRVIAYSSRIISNSLVKGDRKYNYPTVISIILANFKIPELKGSSDFVQHVMLKDDKNRIFSEKMSFLLIDLSKFAARKQFGNLTDDRQKWCYAIKNMWRMEESDIPEKYDVFHELYEDCQLSKLSTMEKEEYEKSVLEYEDVQDAMEYHHRMGKAEGFNDGFEKGIEKGIEEGIVKGREEALLQTAKNFLTLGISPADIAKATGLSEEQIRQLQ